MSLNPIDWLVLLLSVQTSTLARFSIIYHSSTSSVSCLQCLEASASVGCRDERKLSICLKLKQLHQLSEHSVSNEAEESSEITEKAPQPNVVAPLCCGPTE